MGQPSTVILQIGSSGEVQKAEIRRVIGLLQDDPELIKPILSEFLQILLLECSTKGTLEYASWMIELGIFEVLGTVIPHQTDPTILKSASLLQWILVNPTGFEQMSPQDVVPDHIYSLISLANVSILLLVLFFTLSNPDLRERGLASIELWLKTHPDESNIVSQQLVDPLRILERGSTREKTIVFRILALLIKHNATIHQLESIVDRAEDIAKQEDQDEEKEDEEEDLGEAIHAFIYIYRRKNGKRTNVHQLEQELEDTKKEGENKMSQLGTELGLRIDQLEEKISSASAVHYADFSKPQTTHLPKYPLQETVETFTAPTDGWFRLYAIRESAYHTLYLSINCAVVAQVPAFRSNTVADLFVPVKQGSILRVYTNCSTQTFEIESQVFYPALP